MKKIIGIMLAVILTFVTCVFPITVNGEEPLYNVKLFLTVPGTGTTTDEGGSVAGAGNYNAGDKVTLTASPNEGFCSIAWVIRPIGAVDMPETFSTNISITFDMPEQDIEITVNFRRHSFYFEDLGNGTHIQMCGLCGETTGEPEVHTDEDNNEMCDKCHYDWHVHTLLEWNKNEELHWRGCETCGHEYAYYGEHEYNIQNNDETHHWYECECGDIVEKEEHTGKPCDVCGYNGGHKVSFDLYPDRADDGIKEFYLEGEIELSDIYSPDELTYINDGVTHKFMGWKDSSGNIADKAVIEGDTTFTGVWVAQKWVIVTFDLSGGLFTNWEYNILSTTSPRLDELIEYCNGNFIPQKDDVAFETWTAENTESVDENGYVVGLIMLTAVYK